MQRVHRRTFLRSGAVTGAFWAAAHAPAWAGTGPNDTVNLGIVGCGNRGKEHVNAFQKVPGVRIVGLCDPDRDRLDKFARMVPDAQRWTNLRDMYQAPDIDAVVIATCNHWHALAAIWAMEAGKHVYVEKPLSLTHWEGRQLILAANTLNRVFQVGMQQRSDPMQQELKQFLHQDGALGPIQWVLVNRFGARGPIGKRDTPLVPPKSVDYDLWLGPAEDVPIYRNSLHYDWHWMWNTGSGEMGNWGVHILDDVRNVVFLDEATIPEKFVAAGDRVAWHDAGDTPNVQYVVAEAGGIPVVINVCNLANRAGEQAGAMLQGPPTGYTVFCANGRLEGQRGRAAAFDGEGKLLREFRGNTGEMPHRENFIAAVRANNGSLVNSPVEMGHYSTAWCNFSNIATDVSHGKDSTSPQQLADEFQLPAAAEVFTAMQQVVRRNVPASVDLALGPVLRCDVAAEKFVGELAEEANRKLRRTDRTQFMVPEYLADT